ncbi:hypothetical protein B0H21DRAFT_713816, partial [Amylocystis lapponica]
KYCLAICPRRGTCGAAANCASAGTTRWSATGGPRSINYRCTYTPGSDAHKYGDTTFDAAGASIDAADASDIVDTADVSDVVVIAADTAQACGRTAHNVNTAFDAAQARTYCGMAGFDERWRRQCSSGGSPEESLAWAGRVEMHKPTFPRLNYAKISRLTAQFSSLSFHYLQHTATSPAFRSSQMCRFLNLYYYCGRTVARPVEECANPQDCAGASEHTSPRGWCDKCMLKKDTDRAYGCAGKATCNEPPYESTARSITVLARETTSGMFCVVNAAPPSVAGNEEELEVLYDAYYEEFSGTLPPPQGRGVLHRRRAAPNGTKANRRDNLVNFGNNLTVPGKCSLPPVFRRSS